MSTWQMSGAAKHRHCPGSLSSASAGASAAGLAGGKAVAGPEGGVRAGNLIFVAMIGGWYKDAKGSKPARPAAPGVAQQTVDALTIIKEQLEAAGSSLSQLLRVQV